MRDDFHMNTTLTPALSHPMGEGEVVPASRKVEALSSRGRQRFSFQADRGCVVLDQPQQLPIFHGFGFISRAAADPAARDTAALHKIADRDETRLARSKQMAGRFSTL
jgi:hypothetical protein